MFQFPMYLLVLGSVLHHSVSIDQAKRLFIQSTLICSRYKFCRTLAVE